MLRSRTIALAAAAALAVAGCGGGGKSDKDKIQSTVTTYYNAFAAGDMTKACAQLSNRTRTRLETAGKGKCPAILSQATQRPGFERVKAQLKNLKILSTTVTGTTATSRVQLLGASTTAPLT